MPSFLADWMQALTAWPLSAFLRDSTIAYATLNATHILAIGLVIGSIATLDFRLLGLFPRVPLEALNGPLSRVAAAGLILAAASGFLLFSVRPAAYAVNPAFLIKVSLVALGVLNALALRANGRWRTARRGDGIHASIRGSAIVSLIIWAGAILAGRWIGFLQ